VRMMPRGAGGELSGDAESGDPRFSGSNVRPEGGVAASPGSCRILAGRSRDREGSRH
jgi:hypothetical protein